MRKTPVRKSRDCKAKVTTRIVLAAQIMLNKSEDLVTIRYYQLTLHIGLISSSFKADIEDTPEDMFFKGGHLL